MAARFLLLPHFFLEELAILKIIFTAILALLLSRFFALPIRLTFFSGLINQRIKPPSTS
jgi:hypothetical protein